MPAHSLLVDASIYIFRAWFGLPDRWHTPDGMPLNAVVGYLGFLLDLLATRPDNAVAVAVAFDESLGSGFRHRLYPHYKASRALPDEALAFQLTTCRQLTEALGVPCHGGPEYEADDYLATLALRCRQAGGRVTVVTRDKDLGQVLEAGDSWWDGGATRLDVAGFSQRFGVQPAQFADYQALVGDTVDDIPGVPGVGPRTAAALLQHFPDLAALEAGLGEIANLPLRGAASLQQRLQDAWPQVLLSRRLTGLRTDIPAVSAPANWIADARALCAVEQRLAELKLPPRLRRRCADLVEATA